MTSDARPLSAIIADAAGNFRDLIRGEIRLAYAELVDVGVSLRRGAIWLCVAAACGLLGLVYLSGAAFFALALTLPLWAAALALGTALFLLAGLAALMGRRRFKSASGFPRTLATIEETTRWPLQSKS